MGRYNPYSNTYINGLVVHKAEWGTPPTADASPCPDARQRRAARSKRNIKALYKALIRE